MDSRELGYNLQTLYVKPKYQIDERKRRAKIWNRIIPDKCHIYIEVCKN